MASRLLQLFALWTIVIGVVQCCPELCSCQDRFAHQFADCAYKDLLVVPVGLPSNVTTVSLSANKIQFLTSKSFVNITQVTSLWLAHNEIVTIETDTLAPLIQLRNLDISYNKIVNFPWEDLHSLTALQLLKMNNNEMVNLPKDAFSRLKDLRSLRINNNKFTTIVQGTFTALTSMSHVQIFHNPFTCSCSLEWLRDWIATTKISVPEPTSISCDTPEHLKGMMVTNIPKLDCEASTVTITEEPNIPKQNDAAPCLTDQKTPQDPKSQLLADGFSTRPSVLDIISPTEQTSLGLPQTSNLDNLEEHGEECVNQPCNLNKNGDKDKPPSTAIHTTFWQSNPARNSPKKQCCSQVSEILLSIDKKLSSLDARMAVVEVLHNEFKGLHESLKFTRAQLTTIENKNKFLEQSITTLTTQLATVTEENKIMKETRLDV